MTWLALSLGAAFFLATTSAVLKRFFSHLSPWEMALVPFFYATLPCALCLCLIEIPPVQKGFMLTLAWVEPLTMAGFLMHYRAVRMSPLSLTLPFLGFTPVFVIFTGDVILGETPSPAGILGILLVLAGGYVINLDAARFGILGPIRAIGRERGSLLMLLVAAIYALTSVGGKALILKSSPLFAGMVQFLILGPLTTAILMFAGKVRLRALLQKPLQGFGVGLLLFGDALCHNLGISMITAAYMVAVKRMAGIFSVLYGRLWFGEQGIRHRLMGAALMAVGGGVIAVFG